MHVFIILDVYGQIVQITPSPARYANITEAVLKNKSKPKASR